MRIKSFTLSEVLTRCKFLLLTAIVFTLSMPYSHAQIVNVLGQSFETPGFPPPGGWSDSAYTPNPSGPTGYPYWYPVGNNTTSITITPLYPYFGPYTVTGSGIAPYAGNQMLWFNSGYADSGTIAEVATPPMNFASYATIGGQFILSYWVYNQYYANDTNMLYVYLNTSAPNTQGSAVKLDSVFPHYSSAPSGWHRHTVLIPATYNTSSSAYIIFKGVTRYGNHPALSTPVTSEDIFLDSVNVNFEPPCTGVPSGTMNFVTPCSGVPFTFSYSDTLYTNLSYQWFSSTDSLPGSWLNTGITTPTFTATNTVNMYYMLVVHCGLSNTYDTIRRNAILLPFYRCYCADTSVSYSSGANIGNVTISTTGLYPVLNNGNSYPTQNNGSAVKKYTNYDYLPPAAMYRDSTFNTYVTEICPNTFNSGYKAVVFIDYNRNGIFDANEQMLVTPATSGVNNPTVYNSFSFPPTGVQYGITGMRVVLLPSFMSAPYNPCGPYTQGETEDYLVNIVHDQCNGPANAGTAYISDTAICPGYSFTIKDTTHDYGIYGVTYNWQQSPDGITWGDIPYVANQDVLSITLSAPNKYPSYYRFKMICTNAHDTTYSNIVKVSLPPSPACYCVSEAVGGANDTVDIGYFQVGRYVYTQNGITNNSYLNNPTATHNRVDVTPYAWDLGIDSTYNFLLYQVMRNAYGGSARISIMIDFNHDGIYEAGLDSVLTLVTTDTTFFVSSRLTIQPHYYTVPNVYTGMRVIINSDTTQDEFTDQGCGTYISGETIDFRVRLHDSTTAGVNTIQNNIKDLTIFPNPTTGKFKVLFDAASQVNHLNVNVLNITGQQVIMKQYEDVGANFSTDLDLSAQPRGIYFIELVADGEREVRRISVQ